MNSSHSNNTENRARTRGLRPYKPGQCGNRGGRPKGLAALVRSQTKDGKELVELHLTIMRGKLTMIDGDGNKRTPSFPDRLKAAEWLTDRGFGKRVETMTVQNQDSSALIPQHILDAASTIAKRL